MKSWRIRMPGCTRTLPWPRQDAIMTANPDLDVIIAVNDGGTIGSAQAVVNAGKQDKSWSLAMTARADRLHDPGRQQPPAGRGGPGPHGQGFQAMTLLIKAIQGEDYSETKGKTIYLDGIVLSKSNLDGVNQWLEDNK